MADSLILEMKGISKRFGGTIALENVDLDVRYGEVHALVGENGAGKSTLMNILNGSLQQDSGDIFLKNNQINIKNPYIAQKLGISMVHQELKLIPELTVAENIFFGRQTKHFFLNWKTLFNRADKVLAKLGAHIGSDKKVKSLSIAQRQQIEIAKALSQNCDLLILDEPTASLTPEEVNMLFKVIRTLTEHNISIIYISHRLEEIFRISDRITILRDGHKITTLNSSETDQDGVIKLILGTDKLFLREKRKQINNINEEVLKVDKLSIKNRLNNISFSLHRGEILGIAGLMGSGRTELLQSLFGNLNISSGDIYIHNKKYVPATPEKAVKSGVALVPEDRKKQGLIIGMNVKDNITLAGLENFYKFSFLNMYKEKKATMGIVEKLNIKINSIFQNTNSLSGGNQQKIVFGKWLLIDSDILLLDEPTRGIDVGAKEEVFNIIEDLASKGKSIIFVSSELAEVIQISDRILILYNRNIVKDLPRGTDIKTVTKYATGGELYE
ncbi:MAG: sugar ABC transporter ATP-binding protein [Actinobacteria bacterium]|nr:sugar ABC transporter ATP-binding protein [Actinomycetota bacterium]